jgi:hypothetical protein
MTEMQGMGVRRKLSFWILAVVMAIGAERSGLFASDSTVMPAPARPGKSSDAALTAWLRADVEWLA